MTTTWTALPSGEAIELLAGSYLAIVASVKATHTQSDLQAFAAKRGLQVVDYAEQGQRAGVGPDPRSPAYRYVAATVASSQAISLPWDVPWPLSMVDDSQIVSAWSAPAGPLPSGAPTPPAPTPARAPVGPSLWPLAAIGAAGLALALRGRRRRRSVYTAGGHFRTL